MRVLIVEDDTALRESLAENLRGRGFAVDEAKDSTEAEYFANEYALSIAIIDLGLPGKSGADLIEALRRDGKTFPILILTARDHWSDKVAGLNAGADDYMVKPFNLDELDARMHALLRRAAGHAQPLIANGPVELDSSAQTVTLNGQPVDLTAYEYRVLETLLMRQGEVVTKAELTDQLYDQDFERDSNVIEVLMARLRKKLDPDKKLKLIETLRGRGYRISA
jgi:two-component system response regulator PhoP